MITRDDKPVAEIRPVKEEADRHPTGAFLQALDRLIEFRTNQEPVNLDAGALVSRMRDEDER